MGKHDMLFSMFNFLSMGRSISYSKKENAFLISTGEAFFHCFIVLPGNNSANFSAIGHDTFRLPVRVRLMVGWLNPMRLDICSCVIMALIISNNFLYVKPFIAKYNKKLEMPVIIRKYILVFLIKGVVWCFLLWKTKKK